MDDTQRIVKCGSLSLHSSGSFFKRWQAKYLVLYDGSKSGIKRLELFDSEIKFKKQIPAKIIPLLECIRVVTCQRQKTTYTFEVRTNEQFYLLAAQSFQDMNDWVNCLRLVAFGGQMGVAHRGMAAGQGAQGKRTPLPAGRGAVDVLLEKCTSPVAQRRTSAGQAEPPSVPTDTHPVLAATGRQVSAGGQKSPALTVAATSASQAAAAAASALAKTRQRQPSLLGAVKPQPPADSPFIQTAGDDKLLRLQQHNSSSCQVSNQQVAPTSAASRKPPLPGARLMAGSIAHQRHTLSGLDEEEENMLYCSIEDNPSEHNYRVKVIETELSLRCQLKCYQLSAANTISQQYEQLAQFQHHQLMNSDNYEQQQQHESVTFYQLLVGPEELILLNDYAASFAGPNQSPASIQAGALGNRQQQGLWSWPYQCIRRYGFDKDNCFMFEAGRKCTSGPGQFIVQTPKAYNIYQDVVAFVNKLRSSGVHATSALMLEPVPEASQQAEADQQENHNNNNNNHKPTVTQIPVAWTPCTLMSTTEQQQGLPPVSMERRKQFFNSLQQQQSTHKSMSSINEPVGSSSSESPTSLGSSSDAVTSASSIPTSTPAKTMHHEHIQAKGCSDSASTDRSGTSETDESGYEHGDESVDSNKWQTRARITGADHHLNKKRQQPASSDSMSSASSTSSGGSPGHSVSRRVNVPLAQQQPAKDRPQLLMNTDQQKPSDTTTTTKDDKRRPPVRLGAILDSLARDNSEDFEANLIRDVYSEINKLHAKFAVASGSVDDSMSSNSSNDGSGEQDHELENNLTSASMNQAKSRESVYGNLNRALSRSKSDLNVADGSDFDSGGLTRRDRQNYKANGSNGWPEPNYRPQYLANNSYQQHQNNSQQFDQYKAHISSQTPYCGSTIYPTILNPIPECGEPTVVVHRPSKSLQVIRRHQSNLTNSNSKQAHQSASLETTTTKPSASSNQPRNPPTRQLISNNGALSTSNGSGSLIPKLPTKHYVINDVQYAKISRNVGSKIESCL